MDFVFVAARARTYVRATWGTSLLRGASLSKLYIYSILLLRKPRIRDERMC